MARLYSSSASSNWRRAAYSIAASFKVRSVGGVLLAEDFPPHGHGLLDQVQTLLILPAAVGSPAPGCLLVGLPSASHCSFVSRE